MGCSDWYLKVEAATESVLEILPSGYAEAIKIAFEVGNRHFPLALHENTIQVPDDTAMVHLLDRLGVKWERRQTVFNPIGNTQAIIMDSFLSLLQFADGLFPAGAYAHSFGLEYWFNPVKSRMHRGVADFLNAYLECSVAPADAVVMVCAWRAAKIGDPATCLALDETLDAMKTATEMRDASRQMGRQTLRVANHLPCACAIRRLFGSGAARRHPGHHPVIFGMIGGVMVWPAREMVSAFLYSTCAALVGAALRLMPLANSPARAFFGI